MASGIFKKLANLFLCCSKTINISSESILNDQIKEHRFENNQKSNRGGSLLKFIN